MTTSNPASQYEIRASTHQCHRCDTEIAVDSPYYSAIFFDAGGEGGIAGGFLRRDVCQRCWGRHTATTASGAGPDAADNAEAASWEGQDVFAFWRTRRAPEVVDKRPRARFDPEVAFEFFLRLDSTNAGERAEPTAVATETPDAAHSADGATLSTTDTDSAHGAVPSVEQRMELRFVLALLLIRRKLLTLGPSARRDGREWLRLIDKRSKETHWVMNPELTDDQIGTLKDKVCELLQIRF